MDFTLSTLTSSLVVMSPLHVTFVSKRFLVGMPSQDTIPRKKVPSSLLTDDHPFRKGSDHHHGMMDKTTTSQRERESDEIDESDEDETASVVSCSCSSSSSQSDDLPPHEGRTTTRRRVSFPDYPVTAVYTRPTTSPEEHYWLHYNSFDYLDFKLSYWTGVDRTRKVSFSQDLVTETQVVTPWSLEEKKVLYYSQQDLQRFLDEFIQSLG